MFALEITFKDGVSQPEMIFVRRPQAIIGSSDYAHVVVEDLRQLNCQLRLVRDLGRKFRCKPLGNQASSIELSQLLESVFDGDGSVDLGPVRFHFTSLDCDLLLKETEPPDRAGVRVLRQACANPTPVFPAVVVGGSSPMILSFVPDQPIFIGRSKQCALRLDSSDISAKHARLGFEGGEFWIEDLGSTNGTFVNQQQISGRVNVRPGTPIVLGREVSIMGVISEDQIEHASRSAPEAVHREAPIHKYPILISVSEVARPARLVLSPGASVVIGRDPSSELWLGAPHVSRRHSKMVVTPSGMVMVTDTSTNGTAHDSGILRKGDTLELSSMGKVFDFGGGVTVGVCFNEDEEKRFVASMGAPAAFRSNNKTTDNDDESHIPPEQVERGFGLHFTLPRFRQEAIQDFIHFYQSLKTSGRVFVLSAIIAMCFVLVLIAYIIVGLIQKV